MATEEHANGLEIMNKALKRLKRVLVILAAEALLFFFIMCGARGPVNIFDMAAAEYKYWAREVELPWLIFIAIQFACYLVFAAVQTYKASFKDRIFCFYLPFLAMVLFLGIAMAI